MVVFKVFPTCKTIFKVDIMSLILPQLTSLWCIYYNIWTRFYLLYVLKESEVVIRKCSIKKMFLKIPQNSQENICIETHSWRPATSTKTESVQVLSCKFCEIVKNIYFANVFVSLPLKSKIFTGVSFRKLLGFYYKRNRQFFYYGGTSLYIPLKIPKSVNKVTLQNFSE